ncbi:MAG TPA: ABC transporter ATP-binding protein [Candidatus Saccharimonadales bacterium]|nr:ABC transporter ATP-binding protein [Candidatus Saccharimonadales bacterium]
MQKQIFLLFWRSAMKYPFRTLFALIGTVITPLIASFVGPFIISRLLEQLQAGTLTLEGAWPMIALYAGVEIYGQLIGWRINLYFTWTMETAAQRDLYRKIFSTLTQQSLTFHADRFGGALVSQTTKLIGAFERFWDTIFFQVMPSLTSITAATIILSFIFWQYALFLFGVAILFAIAVFFGSRFMLNRNKEEAQASTAANAYVADAVTNVMAIKSHGREAEELEKLTEKAVTWREKSLSTMRGFLATSSIYSGIISALNIGALVAAIWAADQHIVSIGTVYLAITYTFTVARQLWEMNSIMRNYNRLMGDANDMTEILQLVPDVQDTSDKKLHVTHGKIVFDNVQFTHGGADEPLFADFDLTIKPGQRVGLVGHSGSGKTTLTRMLLRFSNLDDGKILIDDQDISNVTQESLRKNIAYVPQEPMLFHRSLRDNIAYGKPGATDDEIRQAAKLANALEFVEKLPEGLDTMVGERGVKLSGGQRQRIVIARAILKDAPILVLDEATSALDSESEKLIQDALSKLMKGRTSLVVAHRLSTIAKLDRIIVLDNGTIVEDGSHNELLKKKGTYASLWAHQSGGFIEE